MGLSVQIDGGGKDFELVEDMIQGGVLADVTDKGMVDNKFKPGTKVHKGYFTWIMSEEDSEGKNKRVFESFTVSLNEKASLRKRLKELGVTDAQLAELKAAKKDLELDQFIGTKRTLVLSKEDGDNGKPFIKITATMPLKKGMSAPDIPADFVRKQDRQD